MPKLRAPKVEEEEKKEVVIPDDQPVTIEVEAEGETPHLEEATPTNGATPHPQEEPDHESEKAALREQINRLTQAERVQRDRNSTLEADRAEAIRRVQEAQNREGQAQYDAILNALEANRSEADAAQQALEAAYTENNAKLIAESQRRISKAEAQIVRLEEGKNAYEEWAQQQRVQPAPKPAPQKEADPIDAGFPQLPQVARDWLRSHQEYVSDPRKNAKIQAIHWDVVDEGHEAYSAGYFESLETKLGLRKQKEAPMTTDNEPTPPKKTSPPPSAPVSRDPPSPSSGKPVSTTRVSLTPQQREAAHYTQPDLPHPEAEKIYAQNLLKLQRLKKEGHYQD